jgi:hypothetical protein
MSKETLVSVSSSGRDDGKYLLMERGMNEGFLFRTEDESIVVTFTHVSAYIEEGHEWADFKDEDDNSHLTISNEQSGEWPHWIFEELLHIEVKGELRPVSDYDTRYELKENREIKGEDS